MTEEKKRILCVDDHTDICELVSFFLKQFEVVAAQSASEAMKKLKEKAFDLFILDHHLIDGTGLELAEFIRSSDKTTPILLFTATSDLTVSQIETVGAQGLISKRSDYAFEELRSTVEQWLTGGTGPLLSPSPS